MTIRVEEKTFAKACKIASKKLKCNIKKLDISVIKKESNGFLGLFKSNAIIDVKKIVLYEENNNIEKIEEKNIENIENKNIENIESKNIEKIESKNIEETENNNIEKIEEKDIENIEKIENKSTNTIDNFEENERFNNENVELAKDIEFKLKILISEIFENINIVEVDIFNKTAHIFIDGEEIPILIGHTGYGYDSAIYFLSIWLKRKYGLFLDLEVGVYKKKKLENLDKYLTFFIKEAKEKEKHRTKVISKILLSHAMKRLKQELPNKYIKIQSTFNKNKFLSTEEFYRN